MSKGSPILKFRLSREEVDAIDAAILSANVCRHDRDYDRSRWIRQAIREKLRKLIRGRRSRHKVLGLVVAEGNGQQLAGDQAEALELPADTTRPEEGSNL